MKYLARVKILRKEAIWIFAVTQVELDMPSLFINWIDPDDKYCYRLLFKPIHVEE